MRAKKQCLECKEEKTITGRGLCGGCYSRFRSAGTLDEKYPSSKSAKGTGDKKAARPAKLQRDQGGVKQPMIPWAGSRPPIDAAEVCRFVLRMDKERLYLHAIVYSLKLKFLGALKTLGVDSEKLDEEINKIEGLDPDQIVKDAMAMVSEGKAESGEG